MLGFETLTASFYSLSMLLTSTNFPDVALPAYKGNRASMLFFISFLGLHAEVQVSWLIHGFEF